MLITLVVRPLRIFPGYQAMAGTLKPPSQVETFPHLNGPALPPYSCCSKSGLSKERKREGGMERERERKRQKKREGGREGGRNTRILIYDSP